MERVHTQFSQYTAFASMLRDVQPGDCGELPNPPWGRNVRALLGMPPLCGTAPEETMSFFERLFEAANSPERISIVNESECRLQDAKMFSAEQKKLLYEIKEDITVVEMAPGAGKTFIVEAIALLFERTDCNKASLITEQNVNMVSEIVDRLKIAMPASLIVRLDYNHSTNEDGWAAAWEAVVNMALDLEVRDLQIVERLIAIVRQTITIILRIILPMLIVIIMSSKIIEILI